MKERERVYAVRVCVLKGGLLPQHYTNTPVEATASQATPSRALPCKSQPVANEPRPLRLTVDDCSPPVANLPSGAAQPLPASLARAIDCTLRLCRPLQRSGHCPLQCQGLPGGGGGRRPAPPAPRPGAKSATRDPRPRATRAARPGPARTFVKSRARPGRLCIQE